MCIGCESGGKVGMYIKDWYKRIFPISLPPPRLSIISQVTPVGPERDRQTLRPLGGGYELNSQFHCQSSLRSANGYVANHEPEFLYHAEKLLILVLILSQVHSLHTITPI
jgi:hypothetical protein